MNSCTQKTEINDFSAQYNQWQGSFYVHFPRRLARITHWRQFLNKLFYTGDCCRSSHFEPFYRHPVNTETQQALSYNHSFRICSSQKNGASKILVLTYLACIIIAFGDGNLDFGGTLLRDFKNSNTTFTATATQSAQLRS